MATGFYINNMKVIEKNTKEPQKVMKQVGEFLRSKMAESFGNQSRGSFKWRPRHVPNIMGILSDLEHGSTVKGRRFEERPALKDTGDLSRSLGMGAHNIEYPSKVKVEVGSPMEYAGTMNAGGEVKKPITETIRKNLNIFLKRKKNKDLRKKLGWLFSKKEYVTTVPARPFAIITETDMKDCVDIIKEKFNK